MKKQIIVAFSIVMMSACGNEDETALQPQNSELIVDVGETENGQTEELGTATEEIVETNTNVASENDTGLGTLQSIIPSGWDITLPKNFPVTQGKYLTAITFLEQQNVATFRFYETDEELAMNDSNISETGQFVGQLVITKYATAEAASEEIDKTVFTDGGAVDLGHGITGYQDAGAGSLFTSWNEGRWAIIARSRTEKSAESLATARETVEFLETHRMPIPKEYGYLHIDAELNGSMAKWQKQNYVYALTDFGDNTLDWLITFE